MKEACQSRPWQARFSKAGSRLDAVAVSESTRSPPLCFRPRPSRSSVPIRRAVSPTLQTRRLADRLSARLGSAGHRRQSARRRR